jgi:hypothetical protein
MKASQFRRRLDAVYGAWFERACARGIGQIVFEFHQLSSWLMRSWASKLTGLICIAVLGLILPLSLRQEEGRAMLARLGAALGRS